VDLCVGGCKAAYRQQGLPLSLSLSLSLSQSNIAYMLIIYLEVTVRVLGNIWMSSAERVKRL
jgi:hypothetical protein